MTSLDALSWSHATESEPTVNVATPRKCRRHEWWLVGTPVFPGHGADAGEPHYGGVCRRCGKFRNEARSRRGRTSRDYGNRAELRVARTYGGTKIGQAGGPVDVRGAEFHTQVKTHRRLPPREWRDAFAKMAASTDRLPRLLLRFVTPAGPEDYIVVPGAVWLDWFGKDE